MTTFGRPVFLSTSKSGVCWDSLQHLECKTSEASPFYTAVRAVDSTTDVIGRSRSFKWCEFGRFTGDAGHVLALDELYLTFFVLTDEGGHAFALYWSCL